MYGGARRRLKRGSRGAAPASCCPKRSRRRARSASLRRVAAGIKLVLIHTTAKNNISHASSCHEIEDKYPKMDNSDRRMYNFSQRTKRLSWRSSAQCGPTKSQNLRPPQECHILRIVRIGMEVCRSMPALRKQRNKAEKKSLQLTAERIVHRSGTFLPY
jgi:hypothetical protein